MMKSATWPLVLCLLMLSGCPAKIADTTPPDLSKFGFTQANNPPLKAPEVVGYLNNLGMLGPQAALAIRAIQASGDCLVETKVAQWAIYTDQRNPLTVGFILKASKNGLTNPGAMIGCLKERLLSGPRTAQFQLCSSMGQYIDSATGDTVYAAYVANDANLCNLFPAYLPNYAPLF